MKKFLFSLFFLTCIFSKEIENPIAYGNIIIEVYKENKFQGIVLVEKNKKYKGLALPGAILNSDETMEEVVCKKVKKSLKEFQ